MRLNEHVSTSYDPKKCDERMNLDNNNSAGIRHCFLVKSSLILLWGVDFMEQDIVPLYSDAHCLLQDSAGCWRRSLVVEHNFPKYLTNV